MPPTLTHLASVPFCDAAPPTNLPHPSEWTIAIVGAGFSGTAVAVHLARQLPAGARLILIEPSAMPGRGLAYANGCASHWLNVPAARLGLDPHHELDFWEWLCGRRPGIRGGDFVPRALMGDYLAETLAQALQAAQLRGVDVVQRTTHVQSLTPLPNKGWQLTLDRDAEPLHAHQVVLAFGFGFQPPPTFPGLTSWQAPGLIPSPLADGALESLREEDDVLILGSGLTAVDVITALQDRGHRGRIHVLSRRGLWPRPHRTLEARPAHGSEALDRLGTATELRTMLRLVRQWVADSQTQGQDWRDVMAGLRPMTATLWQRLSPRDRRQFMRHLMPWWDVHRHRMAPGIHGRLQAERERQRLSSAAGRVMGIAPAASGEAWQVTWRARGCPEQQTLTAHAIINCTGASTRLHASHSPLVAQLLADGLLQPDDHGLGLRVDSNLHPLDSLGQTQANLYYVGPMLKAQWWEAIAIPELRIHAWNVAQAIIEKSTMAPSNPSIIPLCTP